MVIRPFSFLWTFLVLSLLLGVLSASADLGRQGSLAPWQWLESDCANCSLVMEPLSPQLETLQVQKFLSTLSREKSVIMSLYGVHGQEYNLLAHMAVGILGRESEFFKSPRYRMKETFPGLVRVAKVIRAYLQGSEQGPTASSRGPTQIKIVPGKIAEHYGVTADTLHIPENAAVATMGFLIESLEELKRRIVVNDLTFIDESNFADYLPYLYFGSRRMLIEGRATPDQNIYIQDMRRYMSLVRLWEGPSQTLELSPY